MLRVCTVFTEEFVCPTSTFVQRTYGSLSAGEGQGARPDFFNYPITKTGKVSSKKITLLSEGERTGALYGKVDKA